MKVRGSFRYSETWRREGLDATATGYQASAHAPHIVKKLIVRTRGSSATLGHPEIPRLSHDPGYAPGDINKIGLVRRYVRSPFDRANRARQMCETSAGRSQIDKFEPLGRKFLFQSRKTFQPILQIDRFGNV